MTEETFENVSRLDKNINQIPTFQQWFERYFKGDKVIWVIIFSLALIGVLVVYSATGTLAYKELNTKNYLFKHTLYVCTALLAVWIAHRIDYRYYSRLSRIALLISVPLLIIAWQFGVSVNEASRWITIPFIESTFQPSDFAKLALISSIASMLSKRQDNVDDFQETVLPILIWTGIICTLIGLSNVSNAILLFMTSLILMFIGRIPVNQLALFVMMGFISVMLSLYLGQRLDTVLYRTQIYTDSFQNKEAVFQAEQSYIAISTGGFLGKGPGNSTQRNFLPNSYSDFPYAIIVEEYGLLGGFIVLGLYVLLLYRGVVVVSGTNQAFGGILSAGLTISLVLQALINMSVAVGLVPITGLPLPMISMGGTSLLFTGLALGIVLSVSRGETDKDIHKIKLGNENVFKRR